MDTHFAVVIAYNFIRAALFGSNFGPGPNGNRVTAIWDAPLALIGEAIQNDPKALNYHGSLAMVLRQEGKSQEADELLRTELSLKQQLLSTGKAAH